MEYKNVYFLGIGGIGMSALARYFLHGGYAVAGYDRTPSHLTGELEAEGAAVHYEDDVRLIPEGFLDPKKTMVVYTPAVPQDHGEYRYFREHGFCVEKRSQMLGHLAEGKYVMAVAGTHGKATTSTMVAWLNRALTGGGSAFLGGISKNFGGNLVLGDGGRLYKGLGADMVPAMYNLCSKANLIVPNVTEAALLLGESVTLTRGIGVVLIAAGTFLMIEKKGGVQKEENGWMLAAFGSAIFAALTSILGKVGITGVESNLGTALRTGVVLIMAWVMVFVQGKQGQVKAVPKNELGFICLSGLATGASWLCYYKALQLGPASLVAPIDKLSILVTVLFSYIVFHERLSRKALTGLAVLVAGTLVMLV